MWFCRSTAWRFWRTRGNAEDGEPLLLWLRWRRLGGRSVEILLDAKDASIRMTLFHYCAFLR
jgi:hypothetical protein